MLHKKELLREINPLSCSVIQPLDRRDGRCCCNQPESGQPQYTTRMIGFRLDWSYITIAIVFAKPRVTPTSRILRVRSDMIFRQDPGLPIVDARSPNAW